MEFAEKLIELSRVFDITVDSLLKPSEIDELSVKTSILEQKQLLAREQKRSGIFKNTMYSVAVYLTFLAVSFVEHYLFFALEQELWGKPVIFAEFLTATVIVILIWAKSFTHKSTSPL